MGNVSIFVKLCYYEFMTTLAAANKIYHEQRILSIWCQKFCLAHVAHQRNDMRHASDVVSGSH